MIAAKKYTRMFSDILEIDERSVKLDFWEEDEDIRDEEEGDLYSERVLTSENDDMDPITAGVMLGYLAG